MNKHMLKTVQPFFDLVNKGIKNFEFRRDDRGFEVGAVADDRTVSDDLAEPSDRCARVCHDHVSVRLKIAGHGRRAAGAAPTRGAFQPGRLPAGPGFQ